MFMVNGIKASPSKALRDHLQKLTEISQASNEMVAAIERILKRNDDFHREDILTLLYAFRSGVISNSKCDTPDNNLISIVNLAIDSANKLPKSNMIHRAWYKTIEIVSFSILFPLLGAYCVLSEIIIDRKQYDSIFLGLSIFLILAIFSWIYNSRHSSSLTRVLKIISTVCLLISTTLWVAPKITRDEMDLLAKSANTTSKETATNPLALKVAKFTSQNFGTPITFANGRSIFEKNSFRFPGQTYSPASMNIILNSCEMLFNQDETVKLMASVKGFKNLEKSLQSKLSEFVFIHEVGHCLSISGDKSLIDGYGNFTKPPRSVPVSIRNEIKNLEQIDVASDTKSVGLYRESIADIFLMGYIKNNYPQEFGDSLKFWKAFRSDADDIHKTGACLDKIIESKIPVSNHELLEWSFNLVEATGCSSISN